MIIASLTTDFNAITMYFYTNRKIFFQIFFQIFKQKIDRVLDDLRKFLGDDAIIEERCRKLIASGEYEFDESVLDCTPYCDGKP